MISNLFSNNSSQDMLYNYYILNGSPSSLEYNHLLKSNYESNLIHALETDGMSPELYKEYEEFLEKNYNYKISKKFQKFP